MTTQTIEDTINGTTTPTPTPTPAPSTPTPAPTPTPAASTDDGLSAEHADALARAQEILDADEFNRFVDTLEGTDEVDTGVLKTIATKVTKATHQNAAKAAKTADATALKLAELEKQVQEMRDAAAATAQAAAKKAEDEANTSQYQRLSNQCEKTGVDLETSLADPKIKELLQTGSRSEDIPFTYVQEVTAHIGRGDFAKAAKVVAEVVKLAGGTVKDVTVTPEVQAATIEKPKERSYGEEVAELNRGYASSSKNMEATRTFLEAVAALKVKHGR